MPTSRTAARPLTASATIQPTTSAGARLGAAAMTAANSSDAVAAAAQDVAAPKTANTSQPSSDVGDDRTRAALGERREERRREHPQRAPRRRGASRAR